MIDRKSLLLVILCSFLTAVLGLTGLVEIFIDVFTTEKLTGLMRYTQLTIRHTAFFITGMWATIHVIRILREDRKKRKGK